MATRFSVRYNRQVDYPLVIVLKIFTALLNALPVRVRMAILTVIVRMIFLLVPKLRRTSLENLKRAFPDHDDDWRQDVLRKSHSSLARVIMDFARLPMLDEKWVAEHVEFPRLELFRELNRNAAGHGVVIATGHLGSFELMAHVGPMFGVPLSFVARSSKAPHVEKWWLSQRTRNGNKVITRKGAFPEVVKDLQAGKSVGVLFDQNVTRKHAVFVEWFGELAATTKTVALAALKTKAAAIIASVSYLGDERYRVDIEQFDFSSVYADASRTAEEKVRDMTATLSTYYQTVIRKSPHEWFWMHRRWKTRPNE